MDKTFGPQFKKILIMDIAVAVLFIIHCVVFKLIVSQGDYLQELATRMLPSHVVLVILWGVLEVGVILMQANHLKMMRDAEEPRTSDREIYKWMLVANVCMPINILIRQGDIYSFMAIASKHVSMAKTVLFFITLVVPFVIMMVAIVMAAKVLLESRKSKG